MYLFWYTYIPIYFFLFFLVAAGVYVYIYLYIYDCCRNLRSSSLKFIRIDERRTAVLSCIRVFLQLELRKGMGVQRRRGAAFISRV